MVLQSTEAITAWVHAMLCGKYPATSLPPSPEQQHQQAQDIARVPTIHLPPDPPCLAQKLLQC